jgi:hypothetical protein
MEKKAVTTESNEFKNVPDIEPLEILSKVKIPVNQYGLDGKYIKTFESIAQAQKALGISGIGIYRAVNGKAKSCRGFQWRRSKNRSEF